jgi:sugar phosphate isomerase/epimerase
MLKPTFSTVACPELGLADVATLAETHGFEAVELRTFGTDSRRFANDPALTSEAKTRDHFRTRGIEILSLATSCRFDATIFPPVIGFALSDTERSVREAKSAIDLAIALECPNVRVFGFETASREKPKAAVARIAERLRKVCDHADKTGTRIVLENGGSFETAIQLRDLIDAVRHPLLAASYSIAVGHAAGDDAAAAVAALGSTLGVARVKDLRDSRPVRLGEGDIPCREFVADLARTGFDGPVVYEWDRAWYPDLAPASEALAGIAAMLTQWASAGPGAPGAAGHTLAPAVAAPVRQR